MIGSIHSLRKLAVIMLMIPVLFSCSDFKESAKKHSPQDTVNFQSGALDVQLVYSRPFKKDRLIFGEKSEDALVPYGEIWRTGANEATQISFSQEVSIQGQELPAGTYTIYTIPNPERWILAINSRTDYWGKSFFGSAFKEKQDVMRIELVPEKMEQPTEQFTMDFQGNDKGAKLNITWDRTRVSLPFSQ